MAKRVGFIPPRPDSAPLKESSPEAAQGTAQNGDNAPADTPEETEDSKKAEGKRARRQNKES